MIASIITALYLYGAIAPADAYTFLYACALLLIVGEIAVGGHGLIALNGIFAGLFGYAIQTGSNQIFGITIDWSILFGLAFVEALILAFSVYIIIRYRKIKSTTGKETMIGQKARVISWSGKSGMVLIEGENWKAESTSPMELSPSVEVTVRAVEGLTLKIG
jgi:membrane-bound serine protease (ClpP class)